MRWALLILLAGAALAACQKPSDSAPAVNFQRRIGLWHQTIVNGDVTAGVVDFLVCDDANSYSKSDLFGRSPGGMHCERTLPVRGVDGRYRWTQTCSLPRGGTVTSYGALSGDPASKYKVHFEAYVAGGINPALNGRHTTEVEAKWLGPCPAGISGGDVKLADLPWVTSSGHAKMRAAEQPGGGSPDR
jgi:hypothetical protein